MTNLSTLKNALQAFDYNHMTPYAVGFDRQFDRLFDYVTHQAESTGGYPPYNIQKTEDYKFEIEMQPLCMSGLAVSTLRGANDKLESDVASISH